MPKVKVKKTLVNSSDQWCFWVCDGRVLRNLRDLEQALSEMSNDTFAYHVNKERNDFARWLEDVLSDSVLARKMRTMKTRLTALRSVRAELKKYN